MKGWHSQALCPVLCPQSQGLVSDDALDVGREEKGPERLPGPRVVSGNDQGVHKGGRGRCQQQADPRASRRALISPPALLDRCSFISAFLLSQQPRPRASHNPGLG